MIELKRRTFSSLSPTTSRSSRVLDSFGLLQKWPPVLCNLAQNTVFKMDTLLRIRGLSALEWRLEEAVMFQLTDKSKERAVMRPERR
jgi:hypothetical protein